MTMREEIKRFIYHSDHSQGIGGEDHQGRVSHAVLPNRWVSHQSWHMYIIEHTYSLTVCPPPPL